MDINNKIQEIKSAKCIFEKRRDKMFFYSHCNFLRHISTSTLLDETVYKPLFSELENNESLLLKIVVNYEIHYFIIKELTWDSQYFQLPTFKLQAILFSHSNVNILAGAINSFQKSFFNKHGQYCFTFIPSEDTLVLQALTLAKFKLIETRLTYYGANISNFKSERFDVREATLNDIPNLKRVASSMVNEYDRVHADPAIDDSLADKFLETYVEESIKGFADVVLVPNGNNISPDAFVSANYLKSSWDDIGCNVSQMVLSAVSNITCKGWYKKLIIEMTHHLKEQGSEYVYFHPASTNRAVIHTYETLGFKFGQAGHIMSFNN
jgi:dTDP-4-amino-4,6-dideoxy-D-galactose acyltransferase